MRERATRVFSRVTSREAEFGVVPLENSQAGSVNETYDLLQHTSLLRIVGETLIRVDHALLGVSGARLEDITRASSHWQALAQCEEFLASRRIEPVPVHDTAGAARMIAERGERTDAAIASVEAGAGSRAWPSWPNGSRPRRRTSRSSQRSVSMAPRPIWVRPTRPRS